MISAKKTKIVCTIGPATESEKSLTDLLKAGMNVMRLNFSHGDFKEHQGRVNNLRTLTTNKVDGDETKVFVNYPKLPKEVAKGHIIFLHDGRKKLEVLEVKGNDVICKVLVGGEIKGKRGVNLPDSDLSISALTEKDLEDLEFGIKNKVDFFALSFVRRPSDITHLRKILDDRKSKAGIIAKIETPQAVAAIDEIIDLCDGIMVARGDLAIEVPAENVPLIQKMIIKKCNQKGKPVITATQMLESMIKAPVPTRAEVSDIANAILDGTDAIMLSEETTLGDFPVEAVEVMSRVALKVEGDLLHRQLLGNNNHDHISVGESIAAAAVRTADKVDAKFIVALTERGYGARMTARHRSHKAIIAITPNESTFNKVNLLFGTYPVMIDKFKSFDDAVAHIKPLLIKEKLAKKGDKIVLVSGVPFGKVTESNIVMVETL